MFVCLHGQRAHIFALSPLLVIWNSDELISILSLEINKLTYKNRHLFCISIRDKWNQLSLTFKIRREAILIFSLSAVSTAIRGLYRGSRVEALGGSAHSRDKLTEWESLLHSQLNLHLACILHRTNTHTRTHTHMLELTSTHTQSHSQYHTSICTYSVLTWPHA